MWKGLIEVLKVLANSAKEAGKALIAEKFMEFLAGSKENKASTDYMTKLENLEERIKSMEIQLEELEQSLKTTRLIAITSLGLAILIGILFLLLRI